MAQVVQIRVRRQEGERMGTEIYINCFEEEAWGEGTIRGNLEWALEVFFGDSASHIGGN
jgi:hypothetical protein